MITPYNILRHELTGLDVKIVEATHKQYECAGKIVEETKNTLKIRTSDGIKTVPKECVTLELELPDKEIVRIDGKLIASRPEDRIKKRYRIKFC